MQEQKEIKKGKNSLVNIEANNYKDITLKNTVKSKNIIKKIFLYITLKKKLLLSLYNKYYNNLLGIDLELHKKMSGKIKIGSKNGFGKEYDLNSMNLIFKGYYLNRKRNGRGKEYKNNELIFEGEYKNGKRNGQGIEYEFGYDEIIFIGEYLERNKYNGKAFEYYEHDYNEYSYLKFSGEYLKGIKKGKEYDKDGRLIFEGEYLEGKKWNGILNGMISLIK